MKYIIYLLSLVLGLLLAKKTNAQTESTKWSLDDCIEYALENNIVLEVSKNDVEYAKQEVRLARARVLPNLNFSGNASMNYGRSIDPETNSYINAENFSTNYGLNSSLTLFSGFQVLNWKRASKYGYLAGLESQRSKKNELILSIAQAFYHIQYATESANAIQKQVELSTKELDRIERMIEVGKKSKVSSIELQSQLSAHQYNYILANNLIAQSRNELLRLMQFDGKDLEIVSNEFNEEVYQTKEFADPLSVYESAKTKLPNIKQLEYLVLVSKHNVSKNKGGKLPSLYLNAGIGSGYNDINPNSYNDQLKNNRNEYVSASLDIPVFNRLSNSVAIKKSKLHLSNRKLELEQNLSDLYRDIEKSCLDYNASVQLLIASEQSKRFTEITYQEMKKKYEVGLANSTELFTVQNRVLDAEIAMSKARIDFEIQKMWLSYYQSGEILENEELHISSYTEE